ncbi:CHAD domain-containing protein [Neptuniibacter halophilus]|uniref:CHAD domain-containing protein n=1 Tax=Neptuniibacter halophilus TaxID=651666 RepID=UPI002574787C|nr:CHAD domain-containing protein [Neptuniibacter halophilus]
MQLQIAPLHKKLRKLRRRLRRGKGRLDEESIHRLRLLSKQVRAEWVLWPAEKTRYKSGRQAKKLARALAPLRDSQVLLSTLEQLFAGRSDNPQVERVRRYLLSRSRQQGPSRRWVLKRLDKLEAELEPANVAGAVQVDIVLEHSRQAELASARLLDPLQAETFHDWRKRVKSHLFILKRLKPDQTDELKQTRHLAEQLGLLHDLCLLRECFDALGACSVETDSVFQQRECEILQQVRRRGIKAGLLVSAAEGFQAAED